MNIKLEDQKFGSIMVGDLVTVRYFDSEEVKGLVYKDMYGPIELGIGLIMADGTFLGISDLKERNWDIVKFHRNTDLEYNYRSREQVERDYKNGVFNSFFEIL